MFGTMFQLVKNMVGDYFLVTDYYENEDIYKAYEHRLITDAMLKDWCTKNVEVCEGGCSETCSHDECDCLIMKNLCGNEQDKDIVCTLLNENTGLRVS